MFHYLLTCSVFIPLFSRAPLYESINSGTLDKNTFLFWVNELSSQECFVLIAYNVNISFYVRNVLAFPSIV